ncbi:hypothetical protein GBAR_LOCUS3696 [Geodia barretti]|nr:hypothetical protein GBAR_LOCUS3696 [Geodia barretti]
MLHHINELDVIPQLQIADTSRTSGDISSGGLHYSDGHGHIPEVCQNSVSAVVGNPESMVLPSAMHSDKEKFPQVGRPRTRPQRERCEWHYHLGGVRHCRVPLGAELKEVLEVAYVSRVMSKNFRKEGQPEKERLAKITGMDIDKVQEWFKNRRKKDRLLQERAMGRNLPKCHRSRKSTTSETTVTEPNIMPL